MGNEVRPDVCLRTSPSSPWPTARWQRDGRDDCGPAVLALARGRRQRRGSRPARATTARQGRSRETDAQVAQEASLAPDVIVTDKLRSYGAAKPSWARARHEQGSRKNSLAENSHQQSRRRQRKMQRFQSPGSAIRSGDRSRSQASQAPIYHCYASLLQRSKNNAPSPQFSARWTTRSTSTAA
jgi:hypothetical protein